MSWINRKLVLECLRELSSQELQHEVWLSTSGPRVSSFVEVVEQLFTDSALGDALETRLTGLGNEAEQTLLALEKQLTKVNRKQCAENIIQDPAMASVRELAAKALNQVQNED